MFSGNPLPFSFIPISGARNCVAEIFKTRALFAFRLLCAGVLLALTGLPATAQQEPKPANPASTPSSDQNPQNPPEKPEAVPAPIEGTLKLLSRRSIFFPDLAADRNALTPIKKLELATDDSIAPSTLIGDAISAGIDQGTNSLSQYGGGISGYGKRYGSSLATGTTAQYFRTFLLPTTLHEDPRYFVLLHGTAPRRVLYAVTRVFVTETDARTESVNWSELLGPLMAEGLANAYLPPEQRTVGKTFRRYGLRVGFDSAINIVKEYWPTIFRQLRLSEVSVAPQPDPNVVLPLPQGAPPQ